MDTFIPISVTGLRGQAAIDALRFNCLGSLYYFIRVGLRRRRMVEHLHLPLCRQLEKEYIKDVIEWPRDHFKTTIASEGLPMWRSLPFGSKDEDDFRKAGYSPEFIRWQRRVHDPNIRSCIVSENITNAAKIGTRIRWHFESNAIYRSMFPETLPDSSCTWTAFSLSVKRPSTTTGGAHGEGTFDFLGAGSALQSRHYNGLLIQDDLVGRKASESPKVMDSSIAYHQLLAGAFECEDANHESSELIIGNRWGYRDLNSYARENEPWFQITNHSALGGCCDLHSPDTPIFPEEYSFDKLMQIRKRLGSYLFSCQFLNNPASPEDADFDLSWLNYYRLERDGSNRPIVIHEVRDGLVLSDTKVSNLRLAMLTDPNHSGADGRCRHAIVVVGISDNDNWYLLDSWAQATGYEKYFDKLYEMAEKWKIHRVGFETVAAQKYAAFHIEYRNRSQSWPIRIVSLKGEVSLPDGGISRKKEWRIRNILSPVFESGRFWVQRKFQDFINEYQSFPRGAYCDLLDALAYTSQVGKSSISYQKNVGFLHSNQQQARLVGRLYSVQ